MAILNNLLFATKKIAIAERLEQLAGHTPLDLSYKKPSRPEELLTATKSQLNGKYGDLKYIPTVTSSRPGFNYDAGFDPTVLNAVRNKFIDVSGVLIPAKELRKKNDTNVSQNPWIPYGIVK